MKESTRRKHADCLSGFWNRDLGGWALVIIWYLILIFKVISLVNTTTAFNVFFLILHFIYVFMKLAPVMHSLSFTVVLCSFRWTDFLPQISLLTFSLLFLSNLLRNPMHSNFFWLNELDVSFHWQLDMGPDTLVGFLLFFQYISCAILSSWPH